MLFRSFTLLSMVASILLITDYVLSTAIAVVLSAVAGAFFLTFWVLIPWFRHTWIDDDAEEEDLEADLDEGDHAATVRDL